MAGRTATITAGARRPLCSFPAWPGSPNGMPRLAKAKLIAAGPYRVPEVARSASLSLAALATGSSRR